MRIPPKYWRVSRSIEELRKVPDADFDLPRQLADQAKPPLKGHGLLLAAFDHGAQHGLVRYLGVIAERGPDRQAAVVWKQVEHRILVDASSGDSNWMKPGGFGFPKGKAKDYDLDALFAKCFGPSSGT